MTYTEYYFSPERQAGRGVMMVALGIVALCVPGGQTLGALTIAKGIRKTAKNLAKLDSKGK